MTERTLVAAIDAMKTARPELTATLGGEMHLLRAIPPIVIHERVERLRPR
ncbi:HipA domain-containing protein [Burkholderia aenigmatica]|uniref:HipA domain-containing protein n=1 Tax=Burkholderia aenigmatica TaxID=2015348 RepID=A0A6P2IRH4_9BURK|nr:hypothetical protein [Burkholderia aenigmatica]VWB32359.1 HipA domain-containing protein [Burkholderia aenigmatica]